MSPHSIRPFSGTELSLWHSHPVALTSTPNQDNLTLGASLPSMLLRWGLALSEGTRSLPHGLHFSCLGQQAETALCFHNSVHSISTKIACSHLSNTLLSTDRLGYIHAAMTYFMWREDHFWNTTVLQRVLSNLVFLASLPLSLSSYLTPFLLFCL